MLVPASDELSKARAPLVLVVDDHDDTRELYADALRDAGYRVEVAADGNEALARVGDWKPALVLMDLSMPGLDGWEATRRIKENVATADVIIVAVTAHATRLGLQQIEDFGADLILSKPCLPGEIVESVGATLSKRCLVVIEVDELADAPGSLKFRRCESPPVFRVGLTCVCERHYEDALTAAERQVAVAIDRTKMQ